jgi:hypothetical protein
LNFEDIFLSFGSQRVGRMNKMEKNVEGMSWILIQDETLIRELLNNIGREVFLGGKLNSL